MQWFGGYVKRRESRPIPGNTTEIFFKKWTEDLCWELIVVAINVGYFVELENIYLLKISGSKFLF